jgi:hypothetical protein
MEQPRPAVSKLQEWFGTAAAARRALIWLLVCCLLAAATGVALYFLVRGVIEIGNP